MGRTGNGIGSVECGSGEEDRGVGMEGRDRPAACRRRTRRRTYRLATLFHICLSTRVMMACMLGFINDKFIVAPCEDWINLLSFFMVACLEASSLCGGL